MENGITLDFKVVVLDVSQAVGKVHHPPIGKFNVKLIHGEVDVELKYTRSGKTLFSFKICLLESKHIFITVKKYGSLNIEQISYWKKKALKLQAVLYGL